VRSMATRCADAVDLVRRFRDGNPDLKLINHLVGSFFTPVIIFKI
jgi:integrator complex subunit 7